MKSLSRINLIPRNNWDYGSHGLFSAFIMRGNNFFGAKNTIHHFQTNPLWTTSGRASLYAILKALNLPKNAKVGVPLFCCSVVFEAIIQTGLTPQFIDVNLEDANISVDDLEKKISRLAAIVAVHMFGNPCDIDSISTIAGPKPVIEDCAQSLFSKYKGRQTGLLTTASFFSFRCGKYISAGEGSAIFCQDPSLHQKIKQIVNSFKPWSKNEMRIDALETFIKASLYKRPLYGLVGYPIGMKLDKKLNLTAKDGFETKRIASSHHGLIEMRIPNFQEKIDMQTKHAQMLLNSLKPLNFCLPEVAPDCTSNWFQFSLKFQSVDMRDAMAKHLFEKGIDTAKYLDGITEEVRNKFGYLGDCPNAEMLAKTTLLIPIYYKLHSKDIEYIADCINEFSTVSRQVVADEKN